MAEHWRQMKRVDPDFVSVMAESGHVIADVYSAAALPLILAAPQLREACKGLLDRIEHPTGNRESLDLAKDKARAALAAALEPPK